MWLFTLRNPYKLTLYHRPANEQPMHTNTTIEPSSMYRKERFTIVFLERICDVIWGPPERICDVTWGPPVLSSRTSFISFNRSYDGRYKKKTLNTWVWVSIVQHTIIHNNISQTKNTTSHHKSNLFWYPPPSLPDPLLIHLVLPLPIAQTCPLQWTTLSLRWWNDKPVINCQCRGRVMEWKPWKSLVIQPCWRCHINTECIWLKLFGWSGKTWYKAHVILKLRRS